jgi:membrane associated rhomboid family serine protease
MHFLGNMWFLWIFGDNVEDRLGHVGYLLFYLGCGIAASLTHLVTSWESEVPTIGASGAIAGVMGAYFIWYPHSRVRAILPIGGFVQFVEIPGRYFLGIWFVMQFLQSLASSPEGGGVAWWAHIGGFVAGVVVALGLGHTRLIGPHRSEREAVLHQRRLWR